VYEFNSTCSRLTRNSNKLKINSGWRLIEKSEATEPNNLIPAFLESYADFYILFLNEDPKRLPKHFIPNFLNNWTWLDRAEKFAVL